MLNLGVNLYFELILILKVSEYFFFLKSSFPYSDKKGIFMCGKSLPLELKYYLATRGM